MHCYGHALNLACNDDAIRGCRTIQNALENTREITKLIKLSPRRDTIFKKIKNALEHSDSPGIRILCPTRWTVRAEALYSIIENYDVLQEVWEESLEYVKEQEMRSRIRGVALYMQTFDFLFGSIVGETILRNCDNLSKALQKESVTAAEGKKMATLTVQTLQTMRNDEQFALFWEKVKKRQHDLKIDEPQLPRKKRIPKRLDDGSQPYNPVSVEEMYRKYYFEALDLAVNCIKDRIEQPGYALYSNLENLLTKAISGQTYDTELNFVCNFYTTDISKRDLEAQLETLKIDLNVGSDEASVKVVVNYLVEGNKWALFSEIAIIVRLILVMPATNAVSERSFSNLRRLKTYLRSRMSQERLNSLMILHTYKEETDKLDLVAVANEFVQKKEYRKSLFGLFTNDDC